MLRDRTISEILPYPVNSEGKLVTRRSGLSRMKPKLGAPSPNSIGSVDWTLTQMGLTKEKAIELIESIVAGQGENADEKWIRFVLLYRQWEIQHLQGELEEPPTFNQVCHSLNFDAQEFFSTLHKSMTHLFTKMGAMKAAMAIPRVVDRVIQAAVSEEGDVKDRELALKLGGMLEEKGGPNIQINNQQAVMLKSEKDKMRTPLLQFSQTVERIDDEVRKGEE